MYPSTSSSSTDPFHDRGLSADEVASLAYHYGLQAESIEVGLAFVECNAERADYFAREIAERA